jgi:hypothetical protein
MILFITNQKNTPMLFANSPRAFVYPLFKLHKTRFLWSLIVALSLCHPASALCFTLDGVKHIAQNGNCAPTLTTQPQDLVLNACDPIANDLQAWKDNHAGAVIQACSPIVHWFEDQGSTVKTGCGMNSRLTFKFTAIDADGHVLNYTSHVIIQDNSGPNFDMLPMSKTIQCGATATQEIQTWLANAGGAWVYDCGSHITMSHSATPSASCGSTTVTFTAKDACGMRTTSTAILSVVDLVPPSFTSVQANQTITCPATPNFNAPTTNDACGSVTLSFTDLTIGGSCPLGYSVTRTWLATDQCGNTSTASSTVTVAPAPQQSTGCAYGYSFDNDEFVAIDSVGGITPLFTFSPPQGGTVNGSLIIDGYYYVGLTSDIYKVNLATNTITYQFTIPGLDITDIDIDYTTGQVYAIGNDDVSGSCGNGSVMYALDLNTNTAIQVGGLNTSTGFRCAIDIVIAPNGEAWVLDLIANVITPINLTNFTAAGPSRALGVNINFPQAFNFDCTNNGEICGFLYYLDTASGVYVRKFVTINPNTGMVTFLSALLPYTISAYAICPPDLIDLTCPDDLMVTSQAGATGQVVTYQVPTATALCNTTPVTTTRIAGPASGEVFPVGTTTVCYQATDGCGNSETCCFTVTVQSSTPQNRSENDQTSLPIQTEKAFSEEADPFAGIFTVNPNPFSSYIQYNWLGETKTHGKLTIYDLLGRAVISETMSAGSNQIETEWLKAGMYLIQISDDLNKSAFVKMIKGN